MKMDLIQFLKKINFTVRLAQSDCLFLVENLRSFSIAVEVARFYVIKNDNSPLQKIADFIEKEQNPFLVQIFNEIVSRPELVGNKFYKLPLKKEDRVYENKSLLKKAAYKEDWKNVKSLLQEVVAKDFPFLAEHFQSLQPVMDLQQDMRFLGVEFEKLAEYSSLCPQACELSIDWTLTDKPELYLDTEYPVRCLADLPCAAQQNLLKLYTFLFFEKAVFPENFPYVAVDDDNRVNFIDFDYLYSVEPGLRRYAAEYLKSGTVPETLAECRLRRSLDMLSDLCKDVDILPAFEKYFSESLPEPLSVMEDVNQDKQMKAFAGQCMVLQSYSNLPQPQPDKLAYLLKKPCLEKDKMFRKSSAWYYVPLLLLIFLLLKFF